MLQFGGLSTNFPLQLPQSVLLQRRLRSFVVPDFHGCRDQAEAFDGFLGVNKWCFVSILWDSGKVKHKHTQIFIRGSWLFQKKTKTRGFWLKWLEQVEDISQTVIYFRYLSLLECKNTHAASPKRKLTSHFSQKIWLQLGNSNDERFTLTIYRGQLPSRWSTWKHGRDGCHGCNGDMSGGKWLDHMIELLMMLIEGILHWLICSFGLFVTWLVRIPLIAFKQMSIHFESDDIDDMHMYMYMSHIVCVLSHTLHIYV